jgi:broad specificity phosphatase PhoE
MNLTVIFETHATSLDNEAGLASGWSDCDLSPTGVQQAAAVGERRKHNELAAVFTSDLTRAVRTAQIAFGERGLPLLEDRRLRECNYGLLTRRPALEIDACRADHVTDPFPDGESYEEVAQRVRQWLREAIRAHSGSTILVIGHRATLISLEHLIIGIPLRDAVAAPRQWQPGWMFTTTATSP